MNVSALPLTVTADRGFTWSDEETLVLLELWNNIDAQSDFSSGNKRNAIIYEKISESMNNVGFIRTASQCKEKIKRMKREYSLAKQKNKSGRNKKTMRFYELFEKILLEKQNKNPKSTLTKNCSTRSKQKKFVSPTNETLNNQESIQPVEKESNSPWTPDVVLIEENSLSLSIENVSSASNHSDKDENLLRKKRKLNTQITFFKSVIDSLSEKFIKYQSESDAKMLNKIEELENQRNAMDERIQKMWMDFEERRKIDEKEHELKIMSTFKDIITRAKVSSSASKY